MKTLYMFPGQGSQYPGMGRFYDNSTEQYNDQQTWSKSETITGLSLRTLCTQGQAEDLKKTEITQPSIFVTSYLQWQRVKELYPPSTGDAFAGHSLGEYSALVCSDLMEFEEALKLVSLRGRAMSRSISAGEGSMAAIIKLSEADVEDICKQVREDTGQVCSIANINSPEQMVISGTKLAVSQASELCKKKGGRAIALPVSAPFHCPMMFAAREEMKPHLKGAVYRNQKFAFIPNLTGELIEKGYHADFLIDQITGPVKWVKTLLSAYQNGCRRFIEVGPNKVLKGLCEKTLAYDDIEIIVGENLLTQEA